MKEGVDGTQWHSWKAITNESELIEIRSATPQVRLIKDAFVSLTKVNRTASEGFIPMVFLRKETIVSIEFFLPAELCPVLI